MGKYTKGQSLVETVVALGILGFVMVGILTLGINVIGYAINSKAQTQATALAQQGLEVARSYSSCGINNGTYIVDRTIKNSLAPPSGASPYRVELNLSAPFYYFERRVIISDPIASQLGYGTPGDYKLVTVEVSWTQRGAPSQLTRMYGLIKNEYHKTKKGNDNS